MAFPLRVASGDFLLQDVPVFRHFAVFDAEDILSEGETLAMDETWLKRELRANPKRTITLSGSLTKQEKETIEAALSASHGRISGPTGAATKLSVPSRTLDSKIKRLKINVYRFKTAR